MALFNASINAVSKALSGSLVNAGAHGAELDVRGAEVEKRLGWARRVWTRIQRWQQLHHERRQLWRLSDAMLKDIGLSRADVSREASRPFWDDVGWRR
ncbi:Uncharacterized conserved protein YjiS, DUF1127 family [Modicisalibacter muralis]|uniref:Uncharacterized conserved protein YjiS, DUF1127 family n=1 Tax=Modicisalibacter muralis TaxID=119000 RepID=A0A1G9RJV0_9GAMM|nr:DUF1127 domain-containing protein [Halomonas muralis]SDM23493.1 Uncharacterized conserved protein YjiS, DUF1127 family [Halomonas muralis]